MCDASEHAAGYVLLTEDYTDTAEGTQKIYTTVALDSRSLTTGQMSLTMYTKVFLAMHFAFDEFGHNLCGVKKPTIVMRENKALTRFFSSKSDTSTILEFFRSKFQLKFTLAHVPQTEEPAVDNLSRLNFEPQDRIHLKLTDNIPVYHIGIDLASKTLKQDNKHKEIDYHAQAPQTVLPPGAKAQLSEVMNMLPMKSQEMD